MGFGLQTPARVNSGSQQAFRDSVSSADAILAANTASDRKLEKKREAEISIRSSLSEAQENFFKKMQRENKVVSDNLSMELSDALSKCEDTNNLLSTEKGKSNIKEAQHKKDIELLCSSGLQRRLILSDKWHKANSTACAHMFGFHNFGEYKVYCRCLFPDLDLSYGVRRLDPITDWEKCTVTKLRMRRGLTNEIIGAI